MYETCDVRQCTFALNADATQFLQSLSPTLNTDAEKNLRAEVAAWCAGLNLPIQGPMESSTPPCLALAWGAVTELDYAAPELRDASQSGQGILLAVSYTFNGAMPIFTGVAVASQGPEGPAPAPPQP